MTTWTPDLLGDGFENTTLELHDDDEGRVIATLIRYTAPEPSPHTPPTTLATGAIGSQHPTFVFLAIHGWNDYFYHRELARKITEFGGAFYAIDLRKYGRSHMPGQSWGYVTDLSIYDEDIHAALDVIFAEHNYEVPLLLYGHSTGGLTAALWAHRHPELLAGLVLNSPWIELQASSILRQAGQPLVDAVAWMSPTTVIPMSDNGYYQRLLTAWRDENEILEGFDDDDPFITTGWEPDERFRHVPSFPVRAGWLAAILRGHNQVASGLEIDCPIIVFTSARSLASDTWNPQMRGADTVLDVGQIWKRIPGLGSHTTLVKIEDAIHDVVFSRASARRQFYDQLARWIRAFIYQ